MDLFRVRLNCIDHYQANPSEFDPVLPIDEKQSFKVPVLRVFGATETGQKVCAHIHGAFPYLYIECDDSLSAGDVDTYIQRLRLSIDYALAVSYRRDLEGSKRAFVAHITLVKGIPFYGYHVGYRPFFKIYLLNPLHITRLADLLRQGAVMSKGFQPYESHMQYVPQWMCDYNLYGCEYLDCDNVKFRAPVPLAVEIDVNQHKWHDRSIPRSAISADWKIGKLSHCAIEVDICVQDIVNRHSVKERFLHNDFSESINTPTFNEKLVPSLESLWRDETKRRKARMGITDSDSSPFPPEVLITVSAEARGDSGTWIHEEEFRTMVRAIAERERLESCEQVPTFKSMTRPANLERQANTAFESVADLYPPNLETTIATQAVAREKVSFYQEDEKFDVDEDKILDRGEEHEFDLLAMETLKEPGNVKTKDPPRFKRPAKLSSQRDGTISDDEGSPDNQNYQDQFFDPLDQGQDLLGKDIASSAELADSGVRDAGDLSHAKEDAFDVPDDCTSDISSMLSRHRQRVKRHSLNERASKRQKTENGSRQLLSHELEDSERYNAAQTDRCQPTDSAPRKTEKESFQSLFESGEATLLGLSAFDGSQPSSQTDSRLKFPIVKDPNNSSTLRRLSQQSNSEKASGSQEFHSKNHVKSPAVTETPKSNKSSFDSKGKGISQTTPVSASSPKPMSFVERNIGVFGQKLLCLDRRAPSPEEISSYFSAPSSTAVLYQNAYYGKEDDVPARKFQYATKEFTVGSSSAPYLPEFDCRNSQVFLLDDQPVEVPDWIAEDKKFQQERNRCTLKNWEFAPLPPSCEEVEKWLESNCPTAANANPSKTVKNTILLSQVEGDSQKDKNGFKYSQYEKVTTSVRHETRYMSVMSLEVHVNTRGKFVPNPEQDEVTAIFWCLEGDEEDLKDNAGRKKTHAGILVLSKSGGMAHAISQMTDAQVLEEENELDLINHMVDIVRHHDPDVLTGFEVHGGSWGYIIERARLKYDSDLCDEFSRMKSDSHGRFGREADRWGFNQTSTIRITGRHMINVWRAMRSELNLLQYTMENIAFHLLHRRIPHYAFHDLTTWWKSLDPANLAKVIEYFLMRVRMDLEILDKNELIPRISEQARLLGVDFFSVISRGSQFKVESLMFRIAKPENFILISPSRKQVGQQNALECLPLVMEPQSAFYTSPLLVLDFQSLYPSVMIAYNYCYSTFLGRIVDWRGQNKMGFTDYQRQQGLIRLLQDHINIAPNGMMYAKPNIRKSLLAKMLGEILETRVMVKSGMKADKEDKMLQRLLHNRQLALKFIANVTYGYTSASFSGRLPCSEIADSIVQTGRETLEKAIALIHSVEKWGAEVVYGDTDSLFVYLKGKTREQAFDIGEEITAAITDMNPKPVKLKFEKVYHPCVLLAKKRYVGFKYESRRQTEPEFDAKGIETVRRDGTPGEQKLEEKALKLLFRTQDLSQVKKYFQEECSKLMRGHVSIQDFCFAREVKLGTYSDRGPPPPGALISTRRMLEDPRAEPQYGERVPYLVVTGAPGARLIDRCVSPEMLLQNDHLELDAEYYITKNWIPPLERIFNLVGASVRSWYDEMPKFQRLRRIEGAMPVWAQPGNEAGAASASDTKKNPFDGSRRVGGNKRTMESYMKSAACVVCRDNRVDASTGPVCTSCKGKSHLSALALRTRVAGAERRAASLEKVCRSCAQLRFADPIHCDSKDCPVFYARTRHLAALRGTRATIGPVLRMLEGLEEKALEW